MTPHEAEILLDKFTFRLVSYIGFNRIDSDFYGRSEHDANARLSFPWRLSAQGNGLFTARIGLRFESLVKWLHEDPERNGPTFAQPIHLLRHDKCYTEWEFSNADDLEKLSDTILNDLRKNASPFLDRYSRLSNLRQVLESPKKEDWFEIGLDVDSRITTLAAIKFVEGDKSGAIKTLDGGIKALEDTLAGRAHELRKRRFAMDYLRERLIKGDK